MSWWGLSGPEILQHCASRGPSQKLTLVCYGYTSTILELNIGDLSLSDEVPLCARAANEVIQLLNAHFI